MVRGLKTLPPTPADEGVPVEVFPLREEGLDQQSEEIQALDEQPEVVGHDAVMEEHHHRLTRHLETISHSQCQISGIASLSFINCNSMHSCNSYCAR